MIFEHTVNVGDRELTSFALTLAEADAMIAQGFRFEIYDIANGWFQIEQPFAQSGDAETGTWTFRQEAPPTTIEDSSLPGLHIGVRGKG